MTTVARHIPMRRCRACRRVLPKTQLKRWTFQQGELVADRAVAAPGRGYYSCSEACEQKLQNNKKH